MLKALLAMVFIALAPLLTTALRSYGVSASITTLWWFGGACLAIALFGFTFGLGSPVFSTSAIMIAGGSGFVIGGIGNVLIFQSFSEAPNPGIPFAIVSANTILVTLVSKPLNNSWPHLFEGVTLSWYHVVGMILVFAGLVLCKMAPWRVR